MRAPSTRQPAPATPVRAQRSDDPEESEKPDRAEPRNRATRPPVICPVCAAVMRDEHAHYRCDACGWRDSCCF